MSTRPQTVRRRKLDTEPVDEETDQHNFATAVGEAIRHARQTLGWTQAMLAEESQLSPNYVARLERGELGPSLYVAHRISQALGLSIDSLVAQHAVVSTARTTNRRAAVR